MYPILSLCLVLGAFLLIARALDTYLRLVKIPGPIAARFSDLWRFRAQNSKGYASRLVQLHQRYGKLVRIGPNHVSVSDPNAIPIVYSMNPTWVKAPSYFGATTTSKGRTVPSIIAMNEAQHTAVRKSVGRAFSTGSLLDYESHIERSAGELVEALNKEALRSQGCVDVGKWLQFFAMDVLIRIAFSESLGLMQKGGDVEGILAAVMDRFDHWGHWAAMPTADYVLNKSLLATKVKGTRDSPLARVGSAKLEARKRSLNQSDQKDLCQKFLEGQAKHPDLLSDDEVLGIIMSTIGAGADTTAGTLTYTLYLLSKNPEARHKLLLELQTGLANGTISNPPRWIEVSKLPYLDAVLKESMRVLPIASWGLDRVVPPGGTTIAGMFIPGGTVVGCQIDAIHQDQDVYGLDASEFRPERWLEVDEEQRRRMERAFLAFSAGKRVCTGVHIAWLEMKKTLPLIIMNFDLGLANPNQDVYESIRISAVKYPPPIWMQVSRRDLTAK